MKNTCLQVKVRKGRNEFLTVKLYFEGDGGADRQ